MLEDQPDTKWFMQDRAWPNRPIYMMRIESLCWITPYLMGQTWIGLDIHPIAVIKILRKKTHFFAFLRSSFLRWVNICSLSWELFENLKPSAPVLKVFSLDLERRNVSFNKHIKYFLRKYCFRHVYSDIYKAFRNFYMNHNNLLYELSFNKILNIITSFYSLCLIFHWFCHKWAVQTHQFKYF